MHRGSEQAWLHGVDGKSCVPGSAEQLAELDADAVTVGLPDHARVNAESGGRVLVSYLGLDVRHVVAGGE